VAVVVAGGERLVVPDVLGVVGLRARVGTGGGGRLARARLRFGVRDLWGLGPGLGLPLGRVVGDRLQRVGDAAHLLDEAGALTPDGVDVGLQLAQPLLGLLDDRPRLLLGAADPVVGLGARAAGGLLRGLAGALEDRRRLVAHAVERPLHRRSGDRQASSSSYWRATSSTKWSTSARS
jgi:hypothetical protein